MPRKVRVLTTSFGSSTFGPRPFKTVDSNRDMAAALVSAAGPEGADLVCLPENFPTSDLPREERGQSETIPGPTFEALASLAHQHSCWIVGTYNVQGDDGFARNTAVVINRNGDLAGTYAKVHPTVGECIDRGVVPGHEAVVIDTDFGRMGLATCYDIGWPDHWRSLKEQGAELIIWPSAYDGGFPLQAYAWTHFTYVISSVRSDHSKVIDVTGRVIASTSRWHRLAATTIDLEKEVFHTDEHAEKLLRLQQEMGQRVSIQAFTEDHVFTVESNDPNWPVTRIKDHYGLENYRDYHARATCTQDEHRLRAQAGQFASVS